MARVLSVLLLCLSSCVLFSAQAKNDECSLLGRTECRISDACAWIKKECIDAPADECAAFGRRKCRRTDACAWLDRECKAAPAPSPPSCSSARRRKCMHKAPYSDLCVWNKASKVCEDKPLCRDWIETNNTESTYGGTRWGAGLAYINAKVCIPDCVDNPMNQYLPTQAEAPLDGLDDMYREVGLNPYDRDSWCKVVYTDVAADYVFPSGLGATHELIGFGLDCDEMQGSQLTAWMWGWSINADNPLGFFDKWTGSTVCCETCGTCQTEKFHCAEPDPARGAWPCGSNAWGLAGLYNGNNCYPDQSASFIMGS